MSNQHNSRLNSAGATAKRVNEAFEEMKKEAGNEFLGQSEVIKGDDR